MKREIALSNGHVFRYMIASGALAFDGTGWLWERPLVWLGLIRLELFTIVVKTLTLQPRKGNLRWWKPWECVRLIAGGAVNKVGLTNKGFYWWCEKVAPKINFKKYHIVVSIFGDKKELIEMATKLNRFDQIVGIEVNYSCPNTGHAIPFAEAVIDSVKAVVQVSKHPVIVKVSVDQDYLAIARGLAGIAEAISINSVPWKIVFPNGEQSPLWKLEEKVGGGAGGVSGKPAQKHNWKAVKELSKDGSLPVIGPSIMEYGDIYEVRKQGANALSFGTIHLPDYPVWFRPWTLFTNPLKPTRFVERDIKLRS